MANYGKREDSPIRDQMRRALAPCPHCTHPDEGVADSLVALGAATCWAPAADEGPTSTSENVLTPMEACELRQALDAHGVKVLDGGQQ